MKAYNKCSHKYATLLYCCRKKYMDKRVLGKMKSDVNLVPIALTTSERGNHIINTMSSIIIICQASSTINITMELLLKGYSREI